VIYLGSLNQLDRVLGNQGGELNKNKYLLSCIKNIGCFNLISVFYIIMINT